jgi:hypothetical protein
MSVRLAVLALLGLLVALVPLGCREGVDTEEVANSQKEINAQKDSDWQD